MVAAVGFGRRVCAAGAAAAAGVADRTAAMAAPSTAAIRLTLPPDTEAAHSSGCYKRLQPFVRPGPILAGVPQIGADDAVQQIKARLDLVEVVQQHVRLRKQGREFVGLCPFHQEKSPSFSVNQQLQSWYCHGCQRGGDLFTFVEMIEKTDFLGARQILADQSGIELETENPAARQRAQLRRRVIELNQLAVQYYEYVLHSTSAGEPGRRLLAERGVSEETAHRFGLGYAPGGDNFAQFLRKRGRSLQEAIDASLVYRRGQDYFEERLVIPIRDERGQPLGFTGRTVNPTEKRKYVNSPDTAAYSKSRVLFALDLAREAIEADGHAVLMEGQFDVISAHQHGVRSAIASSGTAFTEDQVRILKRFTEEAILVFDSDGAGREASKKAVELFAKEGMRTRVGVVFGGAKDPDEFLRAAGEEASTRWEELLRGAQPGWEFWIRDAIGNLNPRNPGELEIALREVRKVTSRIGDPVMQGFYEQEAANWLQVDPKLMRIHVDAPAKARAPVAAVAGSGKGSASPAGPVAEKKLSVGVSYLLQILAVRPDAAARVREALAPDELDETERASYLRMLETLERGGLEALGTDLSGYPEEEQSLVRRAWHQPPPGVSDADVDEAVRRIRQRSVQLKHRSLRSQLAEAERRRDSERVAVLEAELRELGRHL